MFICFPKAFPRGEYVNLAWSIICFRLDGNISSPLRYSYLLILPDYNADIFAASLLILYFRFSSLILPSLVMISFYIISKKFSLKGRRVSDAKIVLITKKWFCKDL